MPTSRKQDRRTSHQNASVGIERRLEPGRRQKDPLEFMGLFSGVPSHLAYELMERCTVAEFNGGDLVLSPGQENESIRIILSGRLRVHLGNQTSNEFVIINPGECIGEMSIIDGKPVSAYVVADTTCRMLIIHQNEFWLSLGQIPSLARNLLSTLVERMRASNQSALQRLQAQMELEHIQKELAIAGNIQTSLLPSQHPLFPDRNEVELFSLMHPAKNIGGDFYDAFFVAPNKLFIAVGDVSGKGIAAALFMVQSIMHLKTEALSGFSPNEILERVNNSLCINNTAAMFVTLFCGILDTQTGELVYSNGGHNPPITDAVNGNFEFMPIPQGIVVGFMEDVKYKPATMQLKPGDTVFVYTDGVTEAENREKELFSDEKLIGLLAVSGRESAREMVERVRNEITTFSDGADQSDDITILTLRYLGSECV
jgi:sigma-B regulation protein RsbU (phosphoserine phosphatase)